MKIVKIKDMTFADAYVQMFNLLDDCVFVVDIDGKIILYNKANEKLDGMKKEEVIGKHLLDCFKIDRYASSTLRTLDTQKSYVNVYQDYVTALGRKISSVSSSYPLVKNDEMLGVITITKDITRYKEMLDVFHRNNTKSAEKDKGTAHYVFEDIIGRSEALKNNIEISKMAAKTKSNILIYGETGTGKELFAQSIHNESKEHGNFVSINCAAIPENLLESILFGTAKGAFTGAVDQPGLFEEASGGSLFLDELNSMSLNLQSKLLRAIETGKIRRVGENKERLVNPRIISALNVHPLEAIEENIIRRDLYYRLGVVVVTIPPLRERYEDIEDLTEEFIKKYNKKFSKKVKGISEEVSQAFKRHKWLGNVRELEHSIEHSMIVCGDSNLIEIDHIPSFIKENQKNLKEEDREIDILDKISVDLKNRDIKSLLEDMEEMIIYKTLEETNGNVAQAAKELGMNRQTLDYRIKKFDINI